MTPAYLNPPPPSPFPFVELKEDHEQQLHQFFNPPHQPSSSSSLSCPIFFNITQDQRGSHPREPQQKAEEYILNGGSSDREVIPSSSFQSTVVDSNNGHKLSYYKLDQDEDGDKRDSGAAKWMSSKMRLMQKMMSSDCKETNKNVRIVQKFHDQHQNNSTDHETDSPNNSNNFIRVCADCNTTKTPLWRSGPQGPKSLCNACGIRQRKARRAMAAAGGATNRAVLATDTSSTRAKLQNKEKKSRTSYMAQYKKPFKLPSGHPQNGKKKLSFEDFALSLSKNSAFQRVFPKDEEEAAILLMALSCGLIHS